MSNANGGNGDHIGEGADVEGIAHQLHQQQPLETYYSSFPGEEYLTVTLPDYASDRRFLVIKMIVSFVVVAFVLPYVFATKSPSQDTSVTEAAPERSSEERRGKKSRRKGNGRGKNCDEGDRNGTSDDTQRAPMSSASSSSPATPPKEISLVWTNVFTLLGLLSVLCSLFFSDNNLFSVRTIFRVPMFTRDECRKIIAMADDAAKRNAATFKKERAALIRATPGLSPVDFSSDANVNRTMTPEEVSLNKLDLNLLSPPGWKKDRHANYPTTDLNLVADPFTKEDRRWLADRFDARLSPVFERAFGIARGAVRANDIFVVRYDAAKGQQKLDRHTDSSHVSFNILLNEEFEGGGTRFHDRTSKGSDELSVIDVNADIGEAILTHAMILHEGLATISGTRYILVGFNSIDARDPLTGEDTHLSLFSSWFNFSWMQVRFHDGFVDGTKRRRRRNTLVADSEGGEWNENRFVTSLLRDLDFAFTNLADMFAKFRSAKLVEDADWSEYLKAMDSAMDVRRRAEAEAGIVPSRSAGYSSWFAGQQLHLDVLGNFQKKWSTRDAAGEENFREENL